MNCFLNLSFRLLVTVFILTACASRVPTTTSPSVTLGINSYTRFGTTKIESVGSPGVSGTFVAKDNGDGTTTLSIQLDHAGDLNPWGIYAIGDCQHGAPVNTQPIFNLPDIQAGHKEETVETSAYASVPGDLIVIVYGTAPDGTPQMVACANLGGPKATSTRLAAASATPECTSTAGASSAPVPSTDTWLAFSAARNNNTDIYILDADPALRGPGQATPKRLTTDPAADFDPTWSPDGTQIAFRSQRDGNDEIYVMNSDGTCQTNLTRDVASDWSPAWSPDGTKIAFARFFDSNPYTDIAVINADGSGLQRLTQASGEYPAWSPDGRRIAFASARDGNYEIYVMNADGSDQTRLTVIPAYDMSPAWSPDGTQIAFDTQRDGYPPAQVGIGPEFEIHVMMADGSGDVRLTNNKEEDRFPAWGPNGLIAFTHNGALLVMKPDGSHQIQLSESGFFPAWWPVH